VGQSPEEAVVDEDRFRRIHAAVEQLPADEQRLLELAYFEEMPVREAARQLDWHPSKAQRCHEAARRRLHELLGVESLDELEVIVGLAAYVSVTEGSRSWRPSAVFEGAANTLGRGLEATWTKAQGLARRLPVSAGGDNPTAAALGGGAGRVAGACATAAIACLASGVVGPGVGGVNLIGGGAAQSPPQKPQRVADATRPAATGRGGAAVAPATPIPPAQSIPKPENRSGGAKPTASASARRSKRATEAVSSQSLESAATGSEETSSAPVEATSTSYNPPPAEPSSGGSGASQTQVANEQFGP
jgi:hypothetical protein